MRECKRTQKEQIMEILTFILLFTGLGVSFLSAGIAGTVLSGELCRAGVSKGKPLFAIAVVVALFGAAIILCITVFSGYALYDMTVPPEDYVECDIVINEEGHQSIRFTADGEIYRATHLKPINGTEGLKAIFSYKSVDLFSEDDFGNYYKIENDEGLFLVTDGETVFCNEKDLMSLGAYLAYAGSYDYYYRDKNGELQRVKGMDDKIIIKLSNALTGGELRTVRGVTGSAEVMLCALDGDVIAGEYTVFYTTDGTWIAPARVEQPTDGTFMAIKLEYELSIVFNDIKNKTS